MTAVAWNGSVCFPCPACTTEVERQHEEAPNYADW